MNDAIYFKALQIKSKIRNPNQILDRSSHEVIEATFMKQAEKEIKDLDIQKVKYTYPTDINYPDQFRQMLEPPLFLEYLGEPVWNNFELISVVGSRRIHPFTQDWLKTEFQNFLAHKDQIAVVSGGAEGVDQWAHWVSLSLSRPTIVVLPTGLGKIYPRSLESMKETVLKNKGCFLSEFPFSWSVKKSHFYFRNRIIAALGEMCLVAQAQIKSGTFLTVHHALQNGRPILTIPAHPLMTDFSGNLNLISEGALSVQNYNDMLNLWDAEFWSGRVFNHKENCI